MSVTIVETEEIAVPEDLTPEEEPVWCETPAAAEPEPVLPDRRILRFHVSERMLHWAVAVPFLLCAVSGLTLLFGYNLRSDGISRQVFSWLHRAGGLGLILCPAASLLWNLRSYRIHLKNVKVAATWTKDDLKWVALAGPAALSSRYKLPRQHKFNAAEKVNFLTGLITYPLFICTGVVLMLSGTNFLAWIVHVGLALLVLPLILGHIFMALVNPSTKPGLSGMICGFVDRDWAKHHYAVWYEETYGDEEKPEEAPPIS